MFPHHIHAPNPKHQNWSLTSITIVTTDHDVQLPHPMWTRYTEYALTHCYNGSASKFQMAPGKSLCDKSFDIFFTLLSFGKFLKFLVYSSVLCPLKSALCEHTTPPPHLRPTLPPMQFDNYRTFSVAHPLYCVILLRRLRGHFPTLSSPLQIIKRNPNKTLTI